MPRTRNPETAGRLIEAAARILADEGEAAVTARRLGTEVGTSTMAVYTHFGSMEELRGRVWREGFERFGRALEETPLTSDPLVDFMHQGWSYRRFALANRHLYRVMFGTGPLTRAADPDDDAVAGAAFASLLSRLRRAADAGAIRVDDLLTAGVIAWSGVHGHVMIELNGFFDAHGGDSTATYGECLRHLALGFGADPAALDQAAGRLTRR